MNRRGATAAITALVMVALIACAGLALDTARAWLVEDRLKTAIDAASLVAARQMSDPNRVAEATAVFWAQFSQGGGSHGTWAPPSPIPSSARCQRSHKNSYYATATIPTTLFGIISNQSVAFRTMPWPSARGPGWRWHWSSIIPVRWLVITLTLRCRPLRLN